MLRLMISPAQPALTRRSFLSGATISALGLTGLGSAASPRGFSAIPGVTAYRATAGRFRRAANGFVRCNANQERLCFASDGTLRGQYLQGADTYNSAPWDDPAAPHGAADPAFLSGDSGDRIRYAGEHAQPDIFGGAGGGVVIRNEVTNQFHAASNIGVTGVAVGDLLRVHAIVAIDGATADGRIEIGWQGNLFVSHTFNHDASGVITGHVDAWTTRRAGFHDMGMINGKRWWYLWADARAANTNAAPPRIGFGNIAAQAGKSCHVCELMVQKNPATAPAAVPVCAAAKTFAADTLETAITGAGYVMPGLALARSQMTGGAIVPPGIPVGTPYEPLETRIEIVRSAETADRAGIMPNPNQMLYGRPWTSPVNHVLTFGPGWFPRDWYRGTATGETATNLVVRSVFRGREDQRPILGNMSVSQVYVTGAIDIDGVILMAGGDTRTKHIEQADVLTGSGSSFHFIATTSLSVTNCLVMGSTLHPTRARHQVQRDETDAKRVYMGELTLQSHSGGAISLKGTRTHNLARAGLTATANTTPVTYDTDDFCATGFWSDMLFVTRGTINSWTGRRMFGALTAARSDMFLCQTERPIRISSDAGATWSDLPPTFDEKTMPHGFLAEHIGTWDFTTQTFTDAPNPAKKLRVRYWISGSVTTPVINKPGFQWIGSQMPMGTYSRWPDPGDVFRIRNGNQWIDVTFQGGEWRSTGYVRYTGASFKNPVAPTHLISNDFIQINRQFVFANTSNTFDGCVFLGPKGGYFLTGNSTFLANDSQLDNFTVENTVVVSDGTNGLRWDLSSTVGAKCNLSKALFVEAASDFTYADGRGYSLTIGAAGSRNTLNLGQCVTVIGTKAGGGLEPAQGGATYTGTLRTIVAGQRSEFTNWTAPDPKVPQYLPGEFYDAVQGRAKLPAPDRVFDFDLTPFGETDAGFAARAVIAAAKGTHARWNDVIADIKAKWHKLPDRVVTIASTTPVGTVLASGLAGTAIEPLRGGDSEKQFAIAGGQLRLAQPLAGINRVQMLRTDRHELIVLDVTP